MVVHDVPLNKIFPKFSSLKLAPVVGNNLHRDPKAAQNILAYDLLALVTCNAGKGFISHLSKVVNYHYEVLSPARPHGQGAHYVDPPP